MKNCFKKKIAGLLALVMIATSTNFVVADTKTIENQNNNLISDDVTSGSTIADDQIQLMSLLPLEEKDAAIVLSDYTLDELKNMPVQKMLDNIKDSDGKKILISEDMEVVMREVQDNVGKTIVDEYKILSREETIDLSIFENTTGYTMDLIVGDGKQLNDTNIRYIVKVYAQKDFDEVLDFEVYLQDENGNRKKIDCDMQISTEEKEFVEGIKQSIPVYSLYPKERIDTYNKKVYISIISQKEKHPDISAGAFIYDSFNYYETEKIYNDLLFNQDMTQTNAGFYMSRFFLPYSLDVGLFYNKDNENNINWVNSKRNDFDINVKNGNYIFGRDYYLFDFQLITGPVTGRKPAQIGIYDQDENWIDVDESYNYNMNIFKNDDGLLDVDRIITYYLKPDYKENEEYYIRFNEESLVLNENGKIEKIVLGTYTKNDDISALEDIKDIICGKGYKIKCDEDGLRVTALLSYGSKKILFSYIFVANSNMLEFSSLPIVGKADPYFRFTGVSGKDGYVIENGGIYNLDTYYGYGYHTVLINDDKADLSLLKPEFWFGADDYFNLYNIDNDAQKENIDNPTAITKKNQQYTLTWKSDEKNKVRNYWLSVVKKTNDGPKLFVDGPDSGETREILLTDYFENKHDIFVANTGNEPLYVSAILSDDAKNVRLDDYWTVGGENNQKLAAFDVTSTPSDYSELPNAAKIRLLRPDSVEGDGSVSGKLLIEASGNLVNGELDKNDKAYEVYEIYLNDKPENLDIVNVELKDAVKYVPYQSIIATNNKYEDNIVTYTLTGELPEGITFNEETGELYGVPQENSPGKYNITIQANFSNKNFESVKKDFTITVKNNTDENVNNEVDDGFEIKIRIPDIEITEGESIEEQIFEFDYDYGDHSNEFQAVWLDGIKLDSSQYAVEDGSTKITVKSQTISNEKSGTHTIAGEYRVGGKDVKKSVQNFKVTVNSKTPSTPNTPSTPSTPTTPNNTHSSGGGGGGTSSYTVTFNSNGGTAVASAKVKRGNKISFFATPSKAGYSFVGWYTDKELTNEFDKTQTITSAVTLYAKYEPITCKVWFDTNGGETVNSIEVQGDTKIGDIPIISKEGYEFEGWYTDEKLTVPFDENKSITSNMTLYAKWNLRIPDEAPEEAVGFIDVNSNVWYYDDINWTYRQKLMVGYNNALFAPMDKITTSNIVAILARASKDNLKQYENATPINCIDENRWYTSSAKWAVANGIIADFDADKAVSREDIAIILMNYIDYKDIEYTPAENYAEFSDSEMIDASAMLALQTLYSMDIISGRPDNIIDPKETTTRAEFAALIHRMSDKTNS